MWCCDYSNSYEYFDFVFSIVFRIYFFFRCSQLLRFDLMVHEVWSGQMHRTLRKDTLDGLPVLDIHYQMSASLRHSLSDVRYSVMTLILYHQPWMVDGWLTIWWLIALRMTGWFILLVRGEPGCRHPVLFHTVHFEFGCDVFGLVLLHVMSPYEQGTT